MRREVEVMKEGKVAKLIAKEKEREKILGALRTHVHRMCMTNLSVYNRHAVSVLILQHLSQ